MNQKRPRKINLQELSIVLPIVFAANISFKIWRLYLRNVFLSYFSPDVVVILGGAMFTALIILTILFWKFLLIRLGFMTTKEAKGYPTFNIFKDSNNGAT